MPACLHLKFTAYSQSPHQWKRQRKQIRKLTAFDLKLEALSFQAPQAFVASSVLGWMKNKLVGLGSLPQSFCSIWFLSSFFLGHCDHPTFSFSLYNNNCYHWLNVYQAQTLSHLMSISNCKVVVMRPNTYWAIFMYQAWFREQLFSEFTYTYHLYLVLWTTPFWRWGY